MGGLEQSTQQVHGRLDDLESGMQMSENRVTGLDRRVDRVEVRMENLEGRMSHLEVRMGRLEHGIIELKNEMVQQYQNLEKRITDIHDALTTHTRWMFGILGSLLLMLLTFSGGVFVKLMLG
jgi:predicted  nucleic acid-binding Zn-ribbon protein